MKKLFIVFTFIILLLIPPENKAAKILLFDFNPQKEIQVGEELTYEVSYSFIKLGEVKLRVKDMKMVKAKPVYSATAYIDSYDGIPFVDLHQIYESKLNKHFYSDYFKGLVRYEDYSSYTIYNFDYAKSKILIKKGKVYPAEVWTDSLTKADTLYQDGLSIFYYARMNMGTEKTENIPCFVNEEKVYTRLNFRNEVRSIKIDAVDYDIECIKLDGETDFVSVFGLTGFFEGWFSNDNASIPVLARMKVLIGNITLELKSWKREGWIPPKYVN